MDSGQNSQSMAPGSDTIAPKGQVVSALFNDVNAAEGAIRELRDLGAPAAAISVIYRNEDHPDQLMTAGVAREEIGDEALAYRASSELPNQEDLSTTVAEQIGDPMPVVTDFEVPPDEPLGGSDRMGLSRDDDMVRRNEAQTNADIDIYTDFPDKPGGVNPDSPAAAGIEETVQEPMKNSTPPGGTAATGAALGGLGGLLVGLGALAVPGAGPFLAAGPLAAAIGGLLAGGAAGGIIGGLADIGVPEQYAREYAARIEQGGTLVSVRAGEVAGGDIKRVLEAHGGEDVH